MIPETIANTRLQVPWIRNAGIGHNQCYISGMITICLIAYLTVTCFFIVGLAFAAGRPSPSVPEMQILQQELVQSPVNSLAVDRAA